ncbi:TniQ family protein [Rhodovulum sulfidophilum]|uniref:TniQ family protein n=1 Tax=Rhodovulum sulfidophilum TaxID=35806 RepID=UPI0034DE62A3
MHGDLFLGAGRQVLKCRRVERDIECPHTFGCRGRLDFFSKVQTTASLGGRLNRPIAPQRFFPFCTDMGLSFSKVIDGNPEALARLADLSATDVEELRRWSPRYLGNREHEFRGNRLHAKAIKESTIRGCPACLREDAEAAPDSFEGDMYIRGHWLFRPVTLCLKHHHPLVPLWAEANVSRRYDAAARLAEIAPGVWAGKLDKELRAPNPFDEWIEARLAGTPTESWLDQFDLYAAAHFCELLGRAIWAVRFPKWKKFGPERAWMSFEMGFRFATTGEATVRDTLMQLQETIGEPTDGPKKKYGALYDRLAFDLLGEAYAPFRELLRDHIASTWPLGPGDDLMGEPVLERKVHSVRTAARELGMDQHCRGTLPSGAPHVCCNRKPRFGIAPWESWRSQTP